MQTLSIDIETYSSADLAKSGVYKYVEAPDFEILLLAYSFNDAPVQIVDLASGEVLPELVESALQNSAVLKTAHNANFERTCISKQFKMILPPGEWECTMVKAAMLGLPMSLDAVSKVLKLEEKKDAAGKALIRFFSIPCKPTNKNNQRTRNLPVHDSEKWQQFKDYCIKDVQVEKAIRSKIAFFEATPFEKKLWKIDQIINDTGVLVDLAFVNNAIAQDIENKERLTKEAIELTKLDNPNSAAQLKEWLTEEIGESVTSLTKEAIPTLIKDADCEVVKRVLVLRQEMSKTSVKKYEAMAKAVCADGRIRGLLQYYGANRTGRWAGRLVQVQNLPQNHLEDLDLARKCVASNDLDLLELLFGNVPDTLSQLIRTAFVAPKGHRFIVADFSAIEARVIAWLANERWRMQVFATHGKIYEASAAQMFKIPIESVTKGSDLRQKGKVSELALGYQGGPNALIKMGALKMGIAEDELPKLVKMWRNANPAIVTLWNTVEQAAIEALEGFPTVIQHGIKFSLENGLLAIQLPSGRKLMYQNPKLTMGKYDKQLISYEGMDQTTKQWCRQDTYGGKLVENIVQAIARDCLAESMLRLYEVGYKIAMHVHDENVLEVPDGFGRLDEVNEIMGRPIPWAKGLPLKAESYETLYYKKD
ncbi:MAG: DNA polymerase [Chitinophagia bacterium]